MPEKNFHEYAPLPLKGFAGAANEKNSIMFDKAYIENLLSNLSPELAAELKQEIEIYQKVCGDIVKEHGILEISKVRKRMPESKLLSVLFPEAKVSDGLSFKEENINWPSDLLESGVNQQGGDDPKK